MSAMLKAKKTSIPCGLRFRNQREVRIFHFQSSCFGARFRIKGGEAGNSQSLALISLELLPCATRHQDLITVVSQKTEGQGPAMLLVSLLVWASVAMP